MKKAFIAILVLCSTFAVALAANAASEQVVASLDGQNVSLEMLTKYVDDVAGANYKTLLHDEEGLRKLANFYINRALLLEYARQTVNRNDTIVANHNVRSVDEDVMYLTALLKIEVQDKVRVTHEEVSSTMASKKIVSEKQARQEIESEQKKQLMKILLEKVRTGHEIRYLN